MGKLSTFLIIMLMVLTTVHCTQSQPKSDYEIGSNPVVGAVEYKFFLEKKTASPYKIVQGVDYLDPNGDGNYSDSLNIIGTNTLPIFNVRIDNDGAEYRAGIVAVNAAGIYSGVGTFTGNVGLSPATPGGVFFRKKQ